MLGLGWKSWIPRLLVLLLAGFTVPHPTDAQGFVNAVQSRGRVFPEISSGVTAMKRDFAGRYYVLATPPNVIWIYNPDGKRIGQVPRAGETTKIGYASDFDVDAGRVLVADRAVNAVEIFSPDGTFVTKSPVFAPTGVVGLPDKQFAVSTLRSKRLVEIFGEDGEMVRSFGDPAEGGADPDSRQMQGLGKVFGNGMGDIYYAFTAVPDPTVRKYDRFGYAASDVKFDSNLYVAASTPTPDDRVQFGVNYSQTSFSDSYNTWAAIGNKGDIFFGGGLSPGLGAHSGEGPQTAQTATANILSTGMATGPGGGSGGGAGGGMMTAQGVIQPDSVQFHLGGKRQNNGKSSTSDESDDGKSHPTLGGAGMQFSAQSSTSSDIFGSNISDNSFQDFLTSTQAPGLGLDTGAAATARGLGGFGGGGFGGFGVGAGIFPGFGSFGGLGAANSASEVHPFSAAKPGETPGASIPHAGFERGPGDHLGGPHGRFGEGIYNLTATVKVNLDQFVDTSTDKPAITALGVDPVTLDVWAGIGKVLAHFDKNGNYLGDYFIATPEGALIRASAIIVEPDRLIVASDSRGVYEFARSGGPVHSAVPRIIVTPPADQKNPPKQ
jgi:hypothetical protein